MAQAGDWLLGAAFVSRSRNETSAVVSRKKCRSHRHRSTSGAEDEHNQFDQQIRELSSSKLGRRRYRRWVNDNLLRNLAPPVTAFELGTLFTPPPWGEKSVISPLETVMASTQDMAAWEPFRNNVDMDVQAEVLQEDQRMPRKGQGREGRRSAAMNAWSGVERNLRAALRRNPASPLVQELEEKLMAFIKGDGKELVLLVESPYDRLLLHGLSQFHGLRSHTVQVPADADGLVVDTHILIRKTEKGRASAATLSLPQFLQNVQHSDIAATGTLSRPQSRPKVRHSVIAAAA